MAKMSEALYNTLDDWYKKYYSKIYSNEIKLGDYYIIFEKPSIEKNFCFGFDEVGDYDSIQRSHDNAMYANTNSDYLVNKNLNKLIEQKEHYADDDFVVLPSCNKSNVGFLVSQTAIERGYYNEDKIVYRLNEDDKKRLLKIMDEEIEKFSKRLKTYVKKYGTSHVKTWTYSVND